MISPVGPLEGAHSPHCLKKMGCRPRRTCPGSRGPSEGARVGPRHRSRRQLRPSRMAARPALRRAPFDRDRQCCNGCRAGRRNSLGQCGWPPAEPHRAAARNRPTVSQRGFGANRQPALCDLDPRPKRQARDSAAAKHRAPAEASPSQPRAARARALREHEKLVPMRCPHYCMHQIDRCCGQIRVKQFRHQIDGEAAGARPNCLRALCALMRLNAQSAG